MNQPREFNVAVIGNEDQVALMRLAGIQQYKVMEETPHLRENLREAFKTFSEDPSVGIIVIPENWAGYVDDLRYKILEGKQVTPVIIEIPSRLGGEKEDVRQYYRSYTKRLLGFTIEI